MHTYIQPFLPRVKPWANLDIEETQFKTRVNRVQPSNRVFTRFKLGYTFV